MNADKSYKFSCKQCDKNFKSDRSVKQHIGVMHKALKRTAENTENFSKKFHKEAFNLEELSIEISDFKLF